jgi:hypothetical protein
VNSTDDVSVSDNPAMWGLRRNSNPQSVDTLTVHLFGGLFDGRGDGDHERLTIGPTSVEDEEEFSHSL